MFFELLVFSTVLLSGSTQTVYPPPPSSRFFLSNISAAHYSVEYPFPADLFGAPRKVRPDSPDELAPYVHPRILFGKKGWDDLIQRSTDKAFFFKGGTWSWILIVHALRSSMFTNYINTLADANTTAFTGADKADYSTEEAYATYLRQIEPLSAQISIANPFTSHFLFMCAFFGAMQDAAPDLDIHPGMTAKCIAASVNWAKILMANRQVNCNTTCSVLWRTSRRWAVSDDWQTCGASLALAYDVLYGKLNELQRTVIRSALSLVVMERYSWGVANPDAEQHPHMMFSNWATYHGNLYLTNLALQGEDDGEVVPYARAVLQSRGRTLFNHVLNRKFSAVIDAYFTHSIYPDGTTFEDSYSWHLAWREGSFAVLARERQGGQIIDSNRFRNAIHAVTQQTEPWQCGHFVGHASGGGLGYSTYAAFLRYVYPEGVLPRMLYAQRFGRDFNNRACRFFFGQSLMQLLVFGMEHESSPSVPKESIPDTYESLSCEHRGQIPLTFVGVRRGLVIMRGSHSADTAYLHLDARPDSFFVGHDNADRGAFTLSAFRKRWFFDHFWARNLDSRRHSVLHIDGLSHDLKGPSATLLSVDHEVAAVDLTYTYNVQWARGAPRQAPRARIAHYLDDGTESFKIVSYKDKEVHTPWELGWPMEDRAAEIGFTSGMKLFGLDHIAFAGIYQWRRPYREDFIKRYVRSVAMIREGDGIGIAVVVDSVRMSSGKSHKFESYLILHDDVTVDSAQSSCGANDCKVVLKQGGEHQMDIYASGIGNVDYRVESFQDSWKVETHQRVIVRSQGLCDEELVAVLCPHHQADTSAVLLNRKVDGTIEIGHGGKVHKFKVDAGSQILKKIVG